MAAYVIYHQTSLRDPEAYREKYLGPARASIAKYGGRQIIGGDYEVLEGDWQGPRIVVHEFPDMETLKRWYDSDEFRPCKELRLSISEGNMIAAEGFAN